MNNDQQPSDKAIQKALNYLDYDGIIAVPEIRTGAVAHYRTILGFARYIEEHEQVPAAHSRRAEEAMDICPHCGSPRMLIENVDEHISKLINGAGQPAQDDPACIRAAFVKYVAEVSDAMAFQAGVGGRETAGGIISYLADKPEYIEPFLDGGVFKLPTEWVTAGCLSWHANNGEIVTPEQYREARANG